MPTRKKNPRIANEIKRARGRPKGTRQTQRTIEAIRASINARLAVDTLHELCESGGQHDGVRATAAATLLKYRMPAYAPVDNDGETVGPVQFVFEKVDG